MRLKKLGFCYVLIKSFQVNLASYVQLLQRIVIYASLS